MSEYHIRELELQDQDVLVKTLIEMGYKPKIYTEAQRLQGYKGDMRTQSAHIVLPRKQVGSASNDVGFEKGKNGLILHISEYDERVKTFDTSKMIQLYAKNRIHKHIKAKKKYKLASEQTDADGRIKLRVRLR